jgi:hypothetical protein
MFFEHALSMVVSEAHESRATGAAPRDGQWRDAESQRFFRGLVFAVPLALLAWAAIGFTIYWAFW